MPERRLSYDGLTFAINVFNHVQHGQCPWCGTYMFHFRDRCPIFWTAATRFLMPLYQKGQHVETAVVG